MTPEKGEPLEMDDRKTLAEELEYMGQRTTDPEASDLLVQAAQEVKLLVSALRSAAEDREKLERLEWYLRRLEKWAASTEHRGFASDYDRGYVLAQNEVAATLNPNPES